MHKPHGYVVTWYKTTPTTAQVGPVFVEFGGIGWHSSVPGAPFPSTISFDKKSNDGADAYYFVCMYPAFMPFRSLNNQDRDTRCSGNIYLYNIP